MIEGIFSVVQIVVSVLLIGAIMLQAPEGGLSPVFGGGGEMYRSKRNVEKFLIIATIVLSILLISFSIAQLVLIPSGR
ncbi:MAG: preprotein translocase subunit SecG [Patescibacteria group bacterium]